MQLTISNQLGLEHSTVSNFFMNARRRSLDKWQEDIDEVNTEFKIPLIKRYHSEKVTDFGIRITTAIIFLMYQFQFFQDHDRMDENGKL